VEEGATVVAGAKTYKVNLSIWKSINLVGGGRDRTILKANSRSKSVVLLYHDAQVVIKNITITDGKTGLEVTESSVVSVRDSTVSGNGDDGLYVGGSARAWVIGNAFLNNEEYGIYAVSSDNLVECESYGFTKDPART
jgi:hypothetical protein